MNYAEAFQPLYPSIYSHLPANEHLLKLASTSVKDHYTHLRVAVNDVPFKRDLKS
jgi:hypothetical protein